MKILIAYDGSSFSEAALDDLTRAGLPEKGEALIFSVAQLWLPPQDGLEKKNGSEISPYVENLVQKYYHDGEKAVTEAVTFARHAQRRLQIQFRKWKISSEATYGSPAWEILRKAETFQPDLIVVGSHGRSAVGRFFLGSISNKILTEAHCSVRVARGKIEVDPVPVRIIVGFDGSRGAQAAVEAVAARNWRKHSEIRLIAVASPSTPSAIGRFIPPVTHMIEEINQSERDWLEKVAGQALSKLRQAGLDANLHVCPGNPKHLLAEEAEKWGADCVFVGANAFGSRLERVLLGSVSAAVAARAQCSVEVVRIKDD